MTARVLSAAMAGFSANSPIRSMLTEDEKALYFMTARDHYQGRGAVVEIGPWLGGGTVQICRGLAASHHDWKLTVYDRFVWSAVSQTKYPQAALQVGESFLPIFQDNLKEFRQSVTPVAAELTAISSMLPVERDLELLFVDAPKSWSMLLKVLAHVGPHLLPGARVVFQDFLHIASRQIVWLVMSIPELSIVETVENGTAVTCVVNAAIADLAQSVPSGMGALSVSDLMSLWERVVTMLPDERAGDLAAGMAIDLFARKSPVAARRVLDRGIVGKPWHPTIIRRVEKLIKFGNPKYKALLTTIAAYLHGELGSSDLGQPKEPMKSSALFSL